MDSFEKKEREFPIFKDLSNRLKGLKDSVVIKHATKTWKDEVPQERLEKVSKMFDKWIGLIWTEYNLWWTLWKNQARGIDCSHFVAYSLWLPSWKTENTWSLNNKYKNEVKMDEAKPWDLLMWPWHYDPDVKREIGHVEIIVWRTAEGKIITLWASGESREWDKYTVNGEKLPRHNCVGFSIREKEDGMKILRA